MQGLPSLGLMYETFSVNGKPLKSLLYLHETYEGPFAYSRSVGARLLVGNLLKLLYPWETYESYSIYGICLKCLLCIEILLDILISVGGLCLVYRPVLYL